jgi:hypothetical protein
MTDFISINFNESEEQKKYVRPGIHENVVIDSVAMSGTPEKPYIVINFLIEPTLLFQAKLYMTEKAKKYTIRKIADIIEAVSPVRTSNKTMNIGEIDQILKGKNVRLKINGEEYINKEGGISIGTTIPMFDEFVESMLLDKKDSKLTFTEKDVKRLEGPASQPPTNGTRPDSAIPF